ncbi:MAG: peptide chain release factor N(5)-glutamine methyltransferase [Erysipelotrichaceae bacterium]|nr:peptide chain release factor N(5)-glutamine methyltransferase [Erysipelotrichaceae bacterium]
MKTYNDLLHSYHKELEEKDIPAATLRLFLFELCQERGIDLYRDIDREVSKEFLERFESGMQRILQEEPLAYVLGYRWFYGYRFKVNGDVLIPRDETEELAALILSVIDREYAGKEIAAADVGCGSGAIGLTLKKEIPSLKITLTDISAEALEVAKENAKALDCEADFLCGDMLEPLKEKDAKLDILVSNPPYIPQEEVLETSVVDFEPHVALFGGEDGLRFYRILLSGAREIMKEHGYIFFEIGWNQRKNLLALAEQYFPEGRAEVFKDINGKDRMFQLKF